MHIINEKEIIRLSKFLRLVLRHQPQKIGIALDEQGWTDVDFLIRQMNSKGIAITPEILQQVVKTNNKQRFAFDETKAKIRANQGHSVAVELGYVPQIPPPVLYNGTGKKNLKSILAFGIDRRKRHNVHLSSDVATALQVGQRHGEAVVLTINTADMHADGFDFYLTQNKVWLTAQVPVQFIRLLEDLQGGRS